jgi:hypothetical protein
MGLATARLPGLLAALALALSLLLTDARAQARMFLQFILGLELLSTTVALELVALIFHEFTSGDRRCNRLASGNRDVGAI